MPENPKSPENFESALVKEVGETISQIAENHDLLVTWNNKLYSFDKKLKADLQGRGYNGSWRAVPEWHVLVGSTIEDKDLDEEVREYICNEIKVFLRKFKQDHQLED